MLTVQNSIQHWVCVDHPAEEKEREVEAFIPVVKASVSETCIANEDAQMHRRIADFACEENSHPEGCVMSTDQQQ